MVHIKNRLLIGVPSHAAAAAAAAVAARNLTRFGFFSLAWPVITKHFTVPPYSKCVCKICQSTFLEMRLCGVPWKSQAQGNLITKWRFGRKNRQNFRLRRTSFRRFVAGFPAKRGAFATHVTSGWRRRGGDLDCSNMVAPHADCSLTSAPSQAGRAGTRLESPCQASAQLHLKYAFE